MNKNLEYKYVHILKYKNLNFKNIFSNNKILSSTSLVAPHAFISDENLRITDDINEKHSSISQPVAHSALKTDMKVFPTKDEKVINMN